MWARFARRALALAGRLPWFDLVIFRLFFAMTVPCLSAESRNPPDGGSESIGNCVTHGPQQPQTIHRPAMGRRSPK
jgi:hypothetical protein